MASTPTYEFPYPSVGDSPNGPVQIQALADAVEDKIELVDAAAAAETARINTLLAGYDAPTQVGSGTLAVGGNGVTIMSVSIPDPGFAYRIMAAGSCGWGVIAGSVAAALFECSITIDSTIYNTGVMSKGLVRSHSIAANNSQPTCVVPLVQSGDQTGAHDVRLIARNSGPSSYTIPVNDEATLTVWIVPVAS